MADGSFIATVPRGFGKAASSTFGNARPVVDTAGQMVLSEQGGGNGRVAAATVALAATGLVLLSGARVARMLWRSHSRQNAATEPASPGRDRTKTPPSSPGRHQPPRPPSFHGDSSAQNGVAPRWKKGREIGRGNFGCVYIGLHAKTGEMVAIKEMHHVDRSSELQKEWDLLKGLPTHPNVVTIKGLDVQKDKMSLILEWCSGGSLLQILKRYGPIEEELLARYAAQVLGGLGFLHDHGILHRDIKPANVLVDAVGTLKVTDFGLSRHLGSLGAQTAAVGSPVYMSPEAMRGKFSIGSDLWAVAATLCEMCSGELPWAHLSDDKLSDRNALMFHVANPPTDPDAAAFHHPVVPDHLSSSAHDFLLQMFHLDPHQRGTCDSLLQHPFLTQASSRVSTHTPPPPSRAATAVGIGYSSGDTTSSESNIGPVRGDGSSWDNGGVTTTLHTDSSA